MPFTSPGEATPLVFQKLESLRLFARQILEDQALSIKYFAFDQGYQHFKGKNKISVSSSATCVLSLIATGKWEKSSADTKALLHYLISKDTSAGLPKNNPFTIAWILEAITELKEYSDPLDDSDNDVISKMEAMLTESVTTGGVKMSEEDEDKTEGGGAKDKAEGKAEDKAQAQAQAQAGKDNQYPPSAYLTQLVVRALLKRKKLTDELRKAVNAWAWAELTRQLALIQAKSKQQMRSLWHTS